MSDERGKIRLWRAADAAAVPTAVLTHMRAHLIEVGEWLEAVHALVHSAALVRTARNKKRKIRYRKWILSEASGRQQIIHIWIQLR
jgi:hypothetical protein